MVRDLSLVSFENVGGCTVYRCEPPLFILTHCSQERRWLHDIAEKNWPVTDKNEILNIEIIISQRQLHDLISL